jgi:hypothetical protein
MIIVFIFLNNVKEMSLKTLFVITQLLVAMMFFSPVNLMAQEINICDEGLVRIDKGIYPTTFSTQTTDSTSTAGIQIGCGFADTVSLTGDFSDYFGTITLTDGVLLNFNPVVRTTSSKFVVGGETAATTFVKQGDSLIVNGFNGNTTFELRANGILDLTNRKNTGDLVLCRNLLISEWDSIKPGQIKFLIGDSVSGKIICKAGTIKTDDTINGQIDISRHFIFDMKDAIPQNGLTSSFVFAQTHDEPYLTGTPSIMNAGYWREFKVLKVKTDSCWNIQLKANYQIPSKIQIETLADGNGSVVTAQNIVAGDSINLFAICRDEAGNYIENIVASEWSLTRSGGIVESDLTISPNNKSAFLRGRLTGKAIVKIVSSDSMYAESGILTVVPDTVNRFAFTLSDCQYNEIPFKGINTLNALDFYGNLVTTYNAAIKPVTILSSPGDGIVSGLGSGNNNVLNRKNDFSKGIAILTNKMMFSGTDGLYQFIATAANNITGTSAAVSIKHAMSGDTVQDFCNTATVADLIINEPEVQWYAAPIGGDALSPSTSLQNGTAYYGFPILNGCENSERFKVTAYLHQLPTAEIEGDTAICAGNITTLHVSLTGLAPWCIIISDGTKTDTITNIVNEIYPIVVAPALPGTYCYKVIQVSDLYNCKNTLNDSIIIQVKPGSNPSVSVNVSEICYGSNEVILTASKYTMNQQWQKSYDNTHFIDIGNITGLTFAPGKMYQSTFFRLVTTDETCGAQTSNTVNVQVYDSITVPVAGFEQALCWGTMPTQLYVIPPTGGHGFFNYQWQSKTSDEWIDIGEDTTWYQPDLLTLSTWYRVIASDKSTNSCGSVMSNEFQVKVNAMTLPGVISGDQTIVSGTHPSPITSITEGTGDGKITYTWEKSIDEGLTWITIEGQYSSGLSLQALTRATWYRRITVSTDHMIICTAASEPVKISLYPVDVTDLVNTNWNLTVYAVVNSGIYIKGQVGKQTIATLYNVTGKRLLVKNLEEGTLNYLSTPFLKTGVYFLNIQDAKHQERFKVFFIHERTLHGFNIEKQY